MAFVITIVEPSRGIQNLLAIHITSFLQYIFNPNNKFGCWTLKHIFGIFLQVWCNLPITTVSSIYIMQYMCMFWIKITNSFARYFSIFIQMFIHRGDKNCCVVITELHFESKCWTLKKCFLYFCKYYLSSWLTFHQYICCAFVFQIIN